MERLWLPSWAPAYSRGSQPPALWSSLCVKETRPANRHVSDLHSLHSHPRQVFKMRLGIYIYIYIYRLGNNLMVVTSLETLNQRHSVKLCIDSLPTEVVR